MGTPDVRVIAAALHADSSPVKVVVLGLERAQEVLEAVSHAGANARLHGERLVVTAKATQLVDAAGRTGGAALAEPLRERLDAAIAAWHGELPDVHTPVRDLETSSRPLVMGILNVTPDSFSDGGSFEDTDAAVAHGRALLEAGADIVDVGGVSTRPGAADVDEATELARVIGVIEQLAGDGAVVSVDTWRSAVAERAVAAGAAMVNDVSAGRFDDALLPTVASLGVPYVLMHMQGTPATMQDDPGYEDVVDEVFAFLAAQLHHLEQHGIPRERVIVDPGIGFGKTDEHDLALLAATRQFTSLGRPVLIGASRKRVVGSATGTSPASARTAGSTAVAAMSVLQGASIVRVHDVAETVEAVRMAHAIRTAGAAAPDDAED